MSCYHHASKLWGWWRGKSSGEVPWSGHEGDLRGVARVIREVGMTHLLPFASLLLIFCDPFLHGLRVCDVTHTSSVPMGMASIVDSKGTRPCC